MTANQSITQNLSAVRAHIPQEVTLVCVSKFHSVDEIKQAYNTGERHFGESRVQELQSKVAQLPQDICWHFIGHLQTNKVKDLLRLHPFLIESVDSQRLLDAIQREAEVLGIVQNVLLELHVAQEETKTGFSPEQIIKLFNDWNSNGLMPNVQVRGLMAMATNTDDETEIRRCFTTVRALYDQLNATTAKLPMEKLSMGMSDDYRIAIDCGSNMVRIGSAIFGERKRILKAVFFDMDGVLYNSMPFHARAWEEAMTEFGLPFSVDDAYRNEGRTGSSVILEALCTKIQGHTYTAEQKEQLVNNIYASKAARFNTYCPDGAEPMPGIRDVLTWLQTQGIQCWVVTGSGQRTLLERLNRDFPGVFGTQMPRVISSYDVVHGKPDPEPYLKAWERSGFAKNECIVVENAPLGVRAAKAAGLFAVAVNTGPLPDTDLRKEGADIVLPDMERLLLWLQTHVHPY